MARDISWGRADTLAQIRLEATRGVRRPRFLVLGVGLPLALYIAYHVAGIGGANGQGSGGVAWPLYVMVSIAAFGAMNAAVSVAAGDWGDASAERRPTVGPDLFVRGASATLLTLLPLILVGLAAAFGGVRLPGSDWLLLAGSLWLGAVPFVALGLLLGVIFDADTGDVVLLCVLVLLAILGGLFQPIDTLPAELAGLAPVLPSYRLADLGWTALAGHAGDPIDVLVLTGYAVGFGAVAVWRTRIEDAQVGE